MSDAVKKMTWRVPDDKVMEILKLRDRRGYAEHVGGGNVEAWDMFDYIYKMFPDMPKDHNVRIRINAGVDVHIDLSPHDEEDNEVNLKGIRELLATLR